MIVGSVKHLDVSGDRASMPARRYFYVDHREAATRNGEEENVHRAGYGRLFVLAMSVVRDRMLPFLYLVSGAAVAVFLYRYFSSKKNVKFLEDPEVKYSVPLFEKKELSHDTRLFRFKLPSENHRLGLPVGQHINLITRVSLSTFQEPLITLVTSRISVL